MISAILVFSNHSCAMKNQLNLYETGQKTTVELVFQYIEKKEGDKFTLIHQGGYAVFDVDKNSKEVAVIGPCNPCIGLAITDGKSLSPFINIPTIP